EEGEVVEQIIKSKADCLFIAMPTPRKERFLAAYRDHLGVPFIMGVGGSLDVIAGHVQRAPPNMQSMGLEWLYRVYQEPRRMWWRYVKTNTLFAGILIRGMLNQCRGGARGLSRLG
ncbi:MAG TPA: WecB/TagA/CpsF family glycosyltransferase, partial [Geobacterales bacterium]|nr:WecB/TagA/CpsF family glycosyltransferase [Geobacterales bacterium]